jgi:hypothetical protein
MYNRWDLGPSQIQHTDYILSNPRGVPSHSSIRRTSQVGPGWLLETLDSLYYPRHRYQVTVERDREQRDRKKETVVEWTADGNGDDNGEGNEMATRSKFVRSATCRRLR